MKTTVEIAEDLIARTREVARREGTTLRALIEEGLRAALAQREQKAAEPYHWPDLSVAGEGRSFPNNCERQRYDLIGTAHGTVSSYRFTGTISIIMPEDKAPPSLARRTISSSPGMLGTGTKSLTRSASTPAPARRSVSMT